MKITGLQFLLNYGAFVRVIVTEEEARQIVEGFQAGHLKPILAGTNQFGSWAVKVEHVQAIHTVPVEQQPQAIPGQVYPPGLLRPGASGVC